MKVNKEALRLYLVTDRTWLGDKSLASQVEEAIKHGVTFVQLREKGLSNEAFIDAAKQMRQITDQYQVPLIINDNIDVALATKADGVHVGQKDMNAREVRKILGEGKIIGVSARTVEQALKAEADGADYLGVGAVFGTATKEDATKLDHDMLIAICKAVKIPVVAIGGINEKNILKLKDKGIAGVAVVSAILAKPNIGEATTTLSQLVEEII